MNAVRIADIKAAVCWGGIFQPPDPASLPNESLGPVAGQQLGSNIPTQNRNLEKQRQTADTITNPDSCECTPCSWQRKLPFSIIVLEEKVFLKIPNYNANLLLYEFDSESKKSMWLSPRKAKTRM
jgi:hypothetical protein